MAEDFPEVDAGALESGAFVVDMIANGAIAQWAPVVIVAAVSPEVLPRVGTTTSADDNAIFGVKVGPNKTLVAGDVCSVVVHGFAKVKVSEAIARNDALASFTTAGKAKKHVHTAHPAIYAAATAETITDEMAAAFAIALTGTGAADNDIIAVFIQLSNYRT